VIHLLEDPLAEEFLAGRIGKGDSIIVDVEDYKQVDIRKQSEAAIPALPGAGV
jgi:ATP-dependent Clp protease ATP-binding subunit ClpC